MRLQPPLQTNPPARRHKHRRPPHRLQRPPVRPRHEPRRRIRIHPRQHALERRLKRLPVDVRREEERRQLHERRGRDVGKGLVEGDGVVVGFYGRVGGVDEVVKEGGGGGVEGGGLRGLVGLFRGPDCGGGGRGVRGGLVGGGEGDGPLTNSRELGRSRGAPRQWDSRPGWEASWGPRSLRAVAAAEDSVLGLKGSQEISVMRGIVAGGWVGWMVVLRLVS